MGAMVSQWTSKSYSFTTEGAGDAEFLLFIVVRALKGRDFQGMGDIKSYSFTTEGTESTEYCNILLRERAEQFFRQVSPFQGFCDSFVIVYRWAAPIVGIFRPFRAELNLLQWALRFRKGRKVRSMILPQRAQRARSFCYLLVRALKGRDIQGMGDIKSYSFTTEGTEYCNILLRERAG